MADKTSARDGPHIARIAALIGDPARAEILSVLTGGQALTATELAGVAAVTKQTASAHLARLLDAQLITLQAQGRHRYYRLANDDVAHLLESLMGVAYRAGAVRLRSSPREPALRTARLCYDHLAGDYGVQMLEGLVQRRHLADDPAGLRLTDAGHTFLRGLEIDVDALIARRRPLCRHCMDWSARRHHLAGAIGAALLQRFFTLGWARHTAPSRVVSFTPAGTMALCEQFFAT